MGADRLKARLRRSASGPGIVAALVSGLIVAGPAAGSGSGGSGGVPGAPGVKLGPSGSAFYNPPSAHPKGKPGQLIWAQRVAAPKGAIAWRIMYVSETFNGTRVAVSGLVIAPARGRGPKGGRKVLAWAHGTTGGARSCAPSEQNNPAQNLVNYYSFTSPYAIDVGVPALTTFIQRGYVVAATDYQGLGGPGVHQYVVGGTEARNVLDSVRAAQHIQAAHAGNDVVTLGWSQGGGAAIWVGQDAAYGKPLRVLGSAALAPAVELGPQYAGKIPPGPTSVSSPYHDGALQLNVIRGMQAAYPSLPLNQVLTAQGMTALAAYRYECNVHLGDVLEEEGLKPAMLLKFPFPSNWLAKLNANTQGSSSTVAPVLVMQGTADTVVNPNAPTAYVQTACKFRQPVQYSRYTGATHQTIPYVAQNQYLGWIADRFAGKRAPSNCS
jgi:alpha-beta hydrolase superfamily lysophospholipase